MTQEDSSDLGGGDSSDLSKIRRRLKRLDLNSADD